MWAWLLQKWAGAVEGVQIYLFVHYPRWQTFTSTDYFIEEQLKSPEERKKLMEERFAGYKALCSFGLGSLFWSNATGVLSGWAENSGWLEYIYIHAIVTLVLLLNGLVASTFHNTAWCARFAASLGSLSGLILFLGTAHIVSLKFHNYEDQCLVSMIVSSVLATLYWVISVQDPLPLYIMVKTILWASLGIIYLICFCLYMLFGGIIRFFKWFCLLLIGFVWTNHNSIKNRLVGACRRTRNPGQQQSPLPGPKSPLLSP